MNRALPAILAPVLVLAAALPARPARAAFYSGEEILALCTAERGSRDYVEHTYECIAYVTGAVDAFNTTREANKLKSCLPPDVTIDRLRAVTVAYLQDNPEARTGAASTQVFAAVRKEWPCAAPKPAAKPAPRTARKRRGR